MINDLKINGNGSGEYDGRAIDLKTDFK